LKTDHQTPKKFLVQIWNLRLTFAQCLRIELGWEEKKAAIRQNKNGSGQKENS
jgi:hypothetical protein